MIGIVDIGICNVGSVKNMLRRIGVLADVIDRPDQLKHVASMILPGVGHFSEGMRRLNQTGFSDEIRQAAVTDGKPLLGICLGMQMLSAGSEEGDEPGLGLLPARFERFRLDASNERLPVPHMGWSEIQVVKDTALFKDLPKDARFYFVHSYHAVTDTPAIDIARTRYGVEFVSAYAQRNIYGVQFHPEKSHKFGMHVLKNFGRLRAARAGRA